MLLIGHRGRGRTESLPGSQGGLRGHSRILVSSSAQISSGNFRVTSRSAERLSCRVRRLHKKSTCEKKSKVESRKGNSLKGRQSKCSWSTKQATFEKTQKCNTRDSQEANRSKAKTIVKFSFQKLPHLTWKASELYHHHLIYLGFHKLQRSN